MRGVEMAVIKSLSGHTWAGTFALFESLDSGTTWRQNIGFPLQQNDYILDVSLFDTDHILVTGRHGAYTSTNGGVSWRVLLKSDDIQDGASGTFCGSPDTLALIDFDGVAWQSTNAGVTWRQTKLNADAQKIFYHNGAEYAMTGAGAPNGAPPTAAYSGGTVFKSTDGGTSWNPLTGALDQDSYEITYYPCQQALIATVEAHYNALDTASQILLSTDDGASWQLSMMAEPEDIAGGLSTTNLCLFATTTTNGVQRLTGATWESIGGPNMQLDSRSICAIDDNRILAIDAKGNIVRTMNSGGVPIPSQYTPPTVSTFSLFQDSTLSSCDVARATVLLLPYTGATCIPPRIVSQTLVGSDASAFSLDHTADPSLLLIDSAVVTFQPADTAHDYDASLVIVLSDGTRWRIALKAHSIDRNDTRLNISNTTTDTIGDVTIPVYGRIARAVEAQLIFDTTSLVFVSASDASGGELEHTGSTSPMRLRFSTVGGLSADTLQGLLHFQFYPGTARCADVRIDSLRYEKDTAMCGSASGSASTLCYTGGCGYPLLSGLMRYNQPSFSIIPNPAGKEATLIANQALEDVTVSIFDLTGVLRKSSGGMKLDLKDLPPGVYFVRAQSAGGQSTLRLLHVTD